jgi:hypothetical protein
MIINFKLLDPLNNPKSKFTVGFFQKKYYGTEEGILYKTFCTTTWDRLKFLNEIKLNVINNINTFIQMESRRYAICKKKIRLKLFMCFSVKGEMVIDMSN